jgi:hypothetical protein
MQCGDKGLLRFAVFAQSKGKLQGAAIRKATDGFLLSVFKERCEEGASPHP